MRCKDKVFSTKIDKHDGSSRFHMEIKSRRLLRQKSLSTPETASIYQTRLLVRYFSLRHSQKLLFLGFCQNLDSETTVEFTFKILLNNFCLDIEFLGILRVSQPKMEALNLLVNWCLLYIVRGQNYVEENRLAESSVQ